MAVTRLIPELKEDAGAGKTETDALESTRKFLEERVTLRYRREDEEPAGRTNLSSCQPVSFPTSLHFWALSQGVLWNQEVGKTGYGDL